jgi:hypothetical protein
MKHTTLVAAITDVDGASFIGLDTVTVPTLTGGRKNAMQGRITKHMTGASVMVFTNKNTNGYEAMVNRRLVAEGKDPGTFVVGDRAWGTRVPNMPIVEHFKDGDTKYYLEVIFLRSGIVHYELDGMPIMQSGIEGLKEAVIADDQQGGVENKVVIRSFAAESITALRINGKEFH